MSTPTTCNKIKGDGYWCNGKPVTFVGDKGYCARHREDADDKAYPPVSDKRPRPR